MARLAVIDDERTFCEVVQDVLQAEGHEVRVATDGASGLALVREWQPALVLCDLHMQGLSGHDVLRELRRDKLTASLPIVFLTGDPAEALQRQTMELGADDYLSKPIERSQLLRAIDARLARQSQIRNEADRRVADLRGNIAHSVPHEFLTPLTAVLGLSSLLVDEAAQLPPDAIHEAATGILSAGERLHHLIEKFLLFTELELELRSAEARAGRQAPRPTDAAEVVVAAAQRCAAACGRTADLQLSTPGPVRVRMSREHLKALVAELVENACAFSKAGSAVRVTLAQRRDGCFLTVVDEGSGMTRGQLENMGAFVQFEKRRMEQPGTGLGLAIVVRIAELAGGAARLESVPGSGTTATVRIPAAEEQAEPPA
jgi:two-component system, sensor histidine kinase and response regulator